MHEELRDRIRRVFEEQAPLDEALVLHLRDCASCERAYERYAAVERGMGGKLAADWNVGAASRVMARLSPPAPRAKPRVAAWLAPLGAAALGLALFFAPRPEASPELAPRGQAAVSGASFRVLVVREQGGELVVADLAEEVRPGDRLRILSSAREATRIRGVRFLPASGPARPLAEPALVPAGAVEAPLGAVIEVGADWGAGTLSIEPEGVPPVELPLRVRSP